MSNLELSGNRKEIRTENASTPQSLATPPRREFLKSAVSVAAGISIAPYVITSSSRASSVLGTEEHAYEIHHQCVELPSQYNWQTTHNVAVDANNNLYVIHEGRANLKEHPSIFVFDENGKFIRAFGNQFQGGGHGIEVRTEGKEQFLYVAAYQQVKSFSKLTLTGDIVWEKRAPEQAKIYHPDEATNPAQVWGRDRFMPTNFAFLPNGEFFLADGYGSFYIHHFDKDGKWLSAFGGAGDGKGKFNTPHGLWIDDRDSSNLKIVVTDRAHNTLQIFDLEGNYQQTIDGFGLPANVDSQGDLLLVPELKARVSLLDKSYKTVATLGSDVDRISADSGFKIRGDEKSWQNGKFVHPHDACFDLKGNIYVAEWVNTGRVSKLVKKS
jgi:DNA-binding beta-propeller fold protein YncE